MTLPRIITRAQPKERDHDRPTTTPHLLTIDDVADRLGTTPRHIRRLIAERRIPFVKVGWFIRFDPGDLARWLDASRCDATPSRTVPGSHQYGSRRTEAVRGTGTPQSRRLTYPGERFRERQRGGSVAEARTYGERRPYAEPRARIDDLVGPLDGTVQLPITIDWGPARSYDLARDGDRRILYERVLREAASTDGICRWVNGGALVEVWPRLWLPERLRRRWKDALPQLRETAA
jgi:excisionase family DNA binding protein